MKLLLHLLGGFHLHHGQLLDGLASRHQLLIAYLALRAPQAIQRSELAFKLWADSSEEQALTNLRKALHQIKQFGDFIQTDSRTLQLNLSPEDRLDIADFTAALDSAERAHSSNDADAELSALETAAAFYKGDLLPGLYEDWLIPERDRLRNLFIRAMDRLIALHENRKHYRDAIKHAQRLLEADTLREETYRTLIRLHALNNDRAAALNVYHACAGVLSKELNVDPDSATRELYERLIKNDSQILRVNISALPISYPLVAREPEWRILLEEWKQASGGNLHSVLLSGEAGIGKTRLAEELLHWAGRQGIRTLTAACYSAEGQTSFAPVVAWLRSMPLNGLEANQLAELSRLLPELRNENTLPQPMTESWQRQAFFESMARALLTGNESLVLLLDDIQWCDSDTLGWLRYFLHFDKNAKILLLLTLRAEELPANNELQMLLLDLRAEDRLTEMELSRLDEKQTAELGSHLLGKNFSEADSLALFHESEGVPLFVVELANAGVRVDSARKVETGSGVNEAGLPPRLKAILEGRLARLSSPARAVIESAAVIGREFDFDLLPKISELDEGATVNALDELWRIRMIRERGGHYDFSHDKLREVTLAGISPIRLRWLHQRAGEALDAEHTEGDYARIADHFERAGLLNKASEYYIRAVEHAEQLYAFTDALEHLHRAILLEAKRAALASLHERRGLILKMLDKREDAFQAFGQAFELSDDALQKARLNRNQSTLMGRFETEIARDKYYAALEELARIQGKPEFWPEWLDLQLSWVEICYWMQDAPTMDKVLEQVKQPVEQFGTVSQKLLYRSHLISEALVAEHFRLNQSHVSISRETLVFAIDSGDSTHISKARRQLGIVELFARQFEEAEATLHEAILLCQKSNDMNSMLIAQAYLLFTHRCQLKSQAVSVDANVLEQLLVRVSPNPAYQGLVHANRAWVFWLAGDYAQTKHLAMMAFKLWKSQRNPYIAFWLALFPLLAIAVAEQETDQILSFARAMFDPLQMKLVPEVEAALLAVLEADPSNRDLILHLGTEAVEKAKEAGYL